MHFRKLKILYIADSTSVHTQRWVKYFADAGHDIFIITIGKKRQIVPYATHLNNFEQFYYNSPNFIWELLRARRIIRSVGPHVLHAHFVHQYGWMGALSGFHPFVLTPWGTDIYKLPSESRVRVGKILTQYTLKKADAITVISDHLKKSAIKFGADEEKINVLFLGVDTDQFRPDIDTMKLRQSLSISENAPVILSNRNFAPLYNNDIVLEAMVPVLKQFPKAVLILQNAGGRWEREAELRKIAEKKRVTNSIRFLPQYQHDELAPLYALADIYVSVPSWDAGPVSLREAMASGCAPIISDLPAPREWIENEKNGVIVPVRDSEKLSSTICDLIRNDDKRARFNEINRTLIINRANTLEQMSKVEGIYQAVVKKYS
jgi:L-malate glycosyltransferase